MAGITVCHVDEPHDVWGARHNGAGMEAYQPVQKGWLGNPWSMKWSSLDEPFARKMVILMYAGAFDARQQRDRIFRHAVSELEGDRVACYCRRMADDAPPCHLDVVDAFLQSELDHFLDDLLMADPDDWGDLRG